MSLAAPSRSHDELVADQFGPGAGAYVASAAHASGPDLDRIEAIAREHPGALALDLGCGGGHVSYRLAPHAGEVTALDLSPDMLGAVAAEATARGLSNIVTRLGAAERLPFEDGAFDLVVSRFSAHHWRDLDAGLREARRVVRPSGLAVFVDVASPATPLFDTHLQAVEVLRDPSHVRDYGAAEWLAAVGRAGFSTTATTLHQLPLDFAAWVQRMRTPEVHVAAIRSLQQGASASVRERFAIAADGSFVVDVLTIEARPG